MALKESRGESESVVCLHLDHIRKPSKYLKHLKVWTENLGLNTFIFLQLSDFTSIITNSADVFVKDVYLIIVGNEDNTKQFLKLLRTECVDVDKKGKACMERKSTGIFTYKVARKETIQMQTKSPKLLSGSIKLTVGSREICFELNSKWHILPYKTLKNEMSMIFENYFPKDDVIDMLKFMN